MLRRRRRTVRHHGEGEAEVPSLFITSSYPRRAAADGVGDSVGASDGALRSRAVDTDVDGNAREMKCWH